MKVLLIVLTLTSTFVHARGGDAGAGKAKAASCVACHGANGISLNDLWPNLAGQKAGYLFEQLKAFHDGQRVNQMMNGMAKTLSTTDMEDLAAYFSQLK